MAELYFARRTETLEYVQGILEQLCSLVRQQNCEMLGYLIEMAVVEASDLLREGREAGFGSEASGSQRQK